MSLNADLILSSSAYTALVTEAKFARERITQARQCPGVKAVYPLYVELLGTMWKGPQQMEHVIRVLACDVTQPVFRMDAVARCASALQSPGAVLFDLRGKRDTYGVPATSEAACRQTGAELGGVSVRVVGTFEMGTDFVSDGNVILSDRNLARHCPGRAAGRDPLSIVDFGVVQLDDPAKASAVRDQLRDVLPNDVKVWTKQEFIANERRFWDESMGIGFVFKLGKWIGFMVGVIICYQIINADLSDHMAEFATLKAIGHRNGYFVRHRDAGGVATCRC